MQAESLNTAANEDLKRQLTNSQAARCLQCITALPSLCKTPGVLHSENMPTKKLPSRQRWMRQTEHVSKLTSSAQVDRKQTNITNERSQPRIKCMRYLFPSLYKELILNSLLSGCWTTWCHACQGITNKGKWVRNCILNHTCSTAIELGSLPCGWRSWYQHHQ